MKNLKIIRVNADPESKWLELWLQGLPFDRKETEWNGKENLILDSDDWNYCCKQGEFYEWYTSVFDDWPGWDKLIGVQCEMYKDERGVDCLKMIPGTDWKVDLQNKDYTINLNIHDIPEIGYGVAAIWQERRDQIIKYGFTAEHSLDNPVYYGSGQLVYAAEVMLKSDDYLYGRVIKAPENWDAEWFGRLVEKYFVERQKIAGAFIAAELDRLKLIADRLTQ